MKKSLILAFAIALSGGAYAAGKHDHSPKHGGIVVEVKDVDYEIVAKPDVMQIYLRDHGKALKLEGAKAKVTLLNGSEKSEVDLAPAGDKLEAKGSYKVAKGTKGIALVTLAGKSAVSVRFEVK
ncbi:MAG: hypothetical protein EAZ37_06340 [Burkholderiales bacterium]|nr:MAG: hypothetical protein EAZ37_06340 [Burkholderiales bacterium]